MKMKKLLSAVLSAALLLTGAGCRGYRRRHKNRYSKPRTACQHLKSMSQPWVRAGTSATVSTGLTQT